MLRKNISSLLILNIYFLSVLGISADESGLIITKQLCYYVEIIRKKHRLWLPYTCMHLAQRSRPFYGPTIKEPVVKPTPKTAPKKVI